MLNESVFVIGGLGMAVIGLTGLLWRTKNAKNEAVSDYNELLDRLATEREHFQQKTERKNQKKKQGSGRVDAKQRKLQDEVERLRSEIKTFENQRTQEQEERQKEIRRLGDELAHHREQSEVLAQQLKDTVANSVELKQQASERNKERSEQQKEALRSAKTENGRLQGELSQLKAKLKRTEATMSKLKDTLAQHGPDRLADSERRAKQYYGFYNILKGKLEMAEDRCRNWEQALKHLSLWILKRNPLEKTVPMTENLGVLVGQAIEVTGGKPLGPDDEDFKDEYEDRTQEQRDGQPRERLSIVRRSTNNGDTATATQAESGK